MLVRGTILGLRPESSPDGTRLLFMRNNQLLIVPVSGGAPVVATDSAFFGSPPFRPTPRCVVAVRLRSQAAP
jgi:hypothetical protein